MLGEATELAIIQYPFSSFELQMRVGAFLPLNVDLNGLSLGLNWSNSGQSIPRICIQILKFGEKVSLFIVCEKRHLFYVEKLLNPLFNLSPSKIGWILFRYFSFQSLGTIVGTEFFQMLQDEFPIFINTVETTAKKFLLTNSHGLFPSNLGDLSDFPKVEIDEPVILL